MLEDLRPGQVLEGRYELLDFIGVGGFARVWKARDQQLGREVAIKLLNLDAMMLDSSAVPVVLQRFEREARLAASLHHPNVVQIHDIGHLQGKKERPFIVMELLTGSDLKERIDKLGPCNPQTFIPKFIDCLDGLARAHEVGIVHKDLKPSNLFLNDPGRRTEALKLVDFGIAHISQPNADDAGARLTSTGQLLGTPQYLPPEYIHGQHVSPAMDVYQMSLILIEALTAEYVLGDENSLQCLIIHGDGRLEIPRYLLESVLAPVLRKGLSRDPAARYASASQFADALSKIPLAQLPHRPPTQGMPLERIRLDGSPLTSKNARVELAPSLLLEDGLEPGVVPGQGQRSNAPDAYMHTVDSIPAMQHPSAIAQTEHPPQQALQQGPRYTPPNRPTQKSSSSLVSWMLGLCIVVGALGGGSCICCAILGEQDGEPDYDVSVDEPIPGDELSFDGRPATEVPAAPPAVDNTEVLQMLEELELEQDVRGEAITLQVQEIEEELAAGKKDEAIAMCDRLIKEVNGEHMEVLKCYNIILRASWRPARAFGARERKACTLLRGYRDSYQAHRRSIDTQRSIMKCVEHDT